MSRGMDRRGFLGALPATALALRGLPGADPIRSAAAPARFLTLDVIGVQLYTVRSLMASDPDGTLAQIAAIGYRAVEFAGLYGLTPREMRGKLDALGLRAVSSHQSVQEVRGRWDQVLEGAQELGQRLIVVPSIPGRERTADGLRRIADDFNRAGEAARSAGLRFGYHNHSWEFAPWDDGTVPIDLLLERCDAELVDWQVDLFWVVDGGGDPLAYIEANGARVTSVHVKDRTASGDMVAVGDGVIDFETILRRAEELGTEYAFVEHDSPRDPLESVRRSYRYLRTLAG